MAENADRTESVFAAAVALHSPEAQVKYLDQACANDSSLRQQVEILLRAHQRTGHLLDHPPEIPGKPAVSESTNEQPPTVHRGSIIAGRYKLLEVIGEGGMGTVWVAEQSQPVRRKVAIKLIKPGMDSRNVLARFTAERQALAMMDHPHIAKVFDGGLTDQGRPFFAMEYVKGIPITDYCDQARLSLRERLTLFMPVCQAVQHAHQKGIIHRDLKPSNVLICLYDGHAVPKVIDFGLAKAMHQSLTESSVYTGHGMMIGTPLYMSPEQAEHNNLDVDTRTDIYSLGVILYELLTGTTPLEKQQLKDAALNEIMRLIKEVEAPKPSMRLSGSASLPSIAAQRSIEPSRLRQSLAGELDWIVMKSLEKERSRRYETAIGLARDVERYLNDEVVEASPPSTIYRMKKFTWKHRGILLSTAAIMALLSVGVAVSSWLAILARQAEDSALAARDSEASQRKAAEYQQKRAQEETDRARRHLYFAHMHLVHNNWENNQIPAAIDLLNRHRPLPNQEDLRGFEWYYWHRLCNSALLTLRGHTDRVWCVVYSPNGKQLASASFDKTVKVWDTDSGREIASLTHSSPVMGVTYDADGKRLVSADRNSTIRLWDTATWRENLLLDSEGHGTGVVSVALSPDGNRVAVTGKGLGQMWDLAQGQNTSPLPLRGLMCVAFSPDGIQLATHVGTGIDGTNPVKVWNVVTGQESFTGRGHKSRVRGLAFSPDGTRLASGSDDYDVRVWDVAAGQLKLTLRGHSKGVSSVAFSSDGKRLASGSGDRTIKLWDAVTGEALHTLRGHTQEVWSVAFSPDGSRLASASFDHTVKVWNAVTPQEFVPMKVQKRTPPSTNPVRSARNVVFSHDGKLLAWADVDHTPRIGDATTGELLPMGTGQSFAGMRLAEPNQDTLSVWDLASNREILKLNVKVDQSRTAAIALSPNGKRVAAVMQGRTVKVWDVETGQEIRSLTGDFSIGIGFSQDGMLLATGGKDGEVRVWNVITGHQLCNLTGCSNAVYSVTFSPDARWLAAGNKNGDISIWNIVTGEMIHTLIGHDHYLNCLAFSPDGARLASGSADRTLRLWDTATGQETLTLVAHTSVVLSIRFSPDGKRLASAGRDDTGGDEVVKVWDTAANDH